MVRVKVCEIGAKISGHFRVRFWVDFQKGVGCCPIAGRLNIKPREEGLSGNHHNSWRVGCCPTAGENTEDGEGFPQNSTDNGKKAGKAALPLGLKGDKAQEDVGE